MSLKGQKVLVTGAAGFIGSHLCEALIKQGAKVSALLRYTSKQDLGNLEWLDPSAVKSIEILRGDLRDADSVNRAVKGKSVVFHLGAIISVPYSFNSATEFVATNVMGTANVLTAALREGVSRVIHTSTSEVFGTGEYVPMDEHHPLRAQSPYAASKIGADKLAESFYLTHHLPVVTLRPFNTFGPRQSPRAIIPTIISQALAGNTITLGSLTPKRDLTFVTDTVAAYLRAAQAPKAIGELINVGTERMWSVAELVAHIEKILGKKLSVKSTAERKRPGKSEVFRLRCDASKAKKILGWKAMVGLDDGLEHVIDWIANHPHLYKLGVYHV